MNSSCFDTIANKWNIDVIRIPFLSEKWHSGSSYINNSHYEQLIYKAVALSEQFGIYCIIDWHILGNGNPFTHSAKALNFF